ncbi:MAG TPA: APC family permease [Terriglobales bacterium]|nr:APC family permease [Terriglobales bacterium]
MGRWSLLGLMINSIIGSAIFGLPGDTRLQALGDKAWIAYLVAAAGVAVIIACFAEVASRFSGPGGPYLYAREAFGKFAGIQMGWLTFLMRIASTAAASNLFTVYLAEFWPAANHSATRLVVLFTLIFGLAAINFLGVKPGARLSNVFAVSKLVPLLLFVVVGGIVVALGRIPQIAATAASPQPTANAWLEAVLILVFAYGGFESALMPMGEAKDPRTDVPPALFAALAICLVVYTGVQLVAAGLLPSGIPVDRPLAAGARVVVGTSGAALMTAGALISLFGFVAANVLNASRLTYALAEQGDFPTPFARLHEGFRTPWFSIFTFALLVFALAAAANFKWNVTLSAVARLFAYAGVCGALIYFRIQEKSSAVPEARFRVPGAPFLAFLGIAFCAVLATRMGIQELQIISATSIVAIATWFWSRRSTAAGRSTAAV